MDDYMTKIYGIDMVKKNPIITVEGKEYIGIVRCKNCRFFKNLNKHGWGQCSFNQDDGREPNDYCIYGKECF